MNDLVTAVYRQKSKIFLWPLVGIERNVGFRPIKTYIRDLSKNVSENDYALVAPFFKDKSNNYGAFEERHLLSNECFLDFYETHDELVYLFSLKKWKEGYKKVISGKYSTLSPPAKGLINKFWSSTQRNTLIPNYRVNAYLNPNEKIYLQVARELEIDFEDVVKGIEILEPPNLEKETFYESKNKVSAGSDLTEISD